MNALDLAIQEMPQLEHVCPTCGIDSIQARMRIAAMADELNRVHQLFSSADNRTQV